MSLQEIINCWASALMEEAKANDTLEWMQEGTDVLVCDENVGKKERVSRMLVRKLTSNKVMIHAEAQNAGIPFSSSDFIVQVLNAAESEEKKLHGIAMYL